MAKNILYHLILYRQSIPYTYTSILLSNYVSCYIVVRTSYPSLNSPILSHFHGLFPHFVPLILPFCPKNKAKFSHFVPKSLHFCPSFYPIFADFQQLI